MLQHPCSATYGGSWAESSLLWMLTTHWYVSVPLRFGIYASCVLKEHIHYLISQSLNPLIVSMPKWRSPCTYVSRTEILHHRGLQIFSIMIYDVFCLKAYGPYAHVYGQWRCYARYARSAKLARLLLGEAHELPLHPWNWCWWKLLEGRSHAAVSTTRWTAVLKATLFQCLSSEIANVFYVSWCLAIKCR